MMLNSVFEGWIESLSESEFSFPFISLLKAQGFYDIHYCHGPFEIGKDLIAKHIDEDSVMRQYAFQTKVGNLGGSDWDNYRGQIDQLCDDYLTHANYDESLPKEFKLVTTGRLIGKAILDSKALAKTLSRRHEGHFEVWTGSRIIDMMQGLDPSFSFSELPAPLVVLMGLILCGEVNENLIDKYLCEASPSFPASEKSIYEAILGASIVVSLLRKNGLVFHASTVCMHIVRLAIAMSYMSDLSEEKIRTSIDDAFEFFLGITLKDILDVLDPSSDVRDFALASSSGPESFVTYPICCCRVMEILGLAYLWFREKEMSDKADWSIGKLVELVKNQPGCLHPISNRYATSYPPAVIALSIAGKQDVADYLVRNTVVNVCDTITSTSPFGLASPYADPTEEINRVLGSAFSIFNYNMNPDSLLAVVFSDLCAEYLPELYADVVNDFKAVGAVFSTVFPQDKYNALFKNRGECQATICSSCRIASLNNVTER